MVLHSPSQLGLLPSLSLSSLELFIPHPLDSKSLSHLPCLQSFELHNLNLCYVGPKPELYIIIPCTCSVYRSWLAAQAACMIIIFLLPVTFFMCIIYNNAYCCITINFVIYLDGQQSEAHFEKYCISRDL